MENKEEKDIKPKVTPMHFCIEEKDVEKQYDCDAFVLYKAGGFMHYMAKGGYHVFVKPDYEVLYGTLSLLLDALIETKNRGEVEKQGMLDLADFVSSILFAPTMLFDDEKIAIEAYENIQKYVHRLYEQAASELKKEDFEANNDFESAVKSAEELVENLKGIADAMPEETDNQQ